MLINEFLEKSAYLYPDKIALIYSGKRLTFKEINDASNSLANGLIESGFRRNDRAIIYLDNTVETVVSLFGILKAGGIFVIINTQVKQKKFTQIINNCIPSILITDSRHFMQFSQDPANFSTIYRTVLIDYEKVDNHTIGNGLLSYKSFIDQSPSHTVAPRCIDIDPACLIYTSGSSGNSKGVTLTHCNVESAANSIIQYLQNTNEDIILDALPLSFDYGLYQVLMSFKFGGTVVLEKAFIYPEQILNLVVREQVTGWPMVPTMIALLLKLKNLASHDFSKLRYITSTGQVLPVKHINALRNTFPSVEIYSMYGLTECKRVSYLPPAELDKRPGSVGKAMPNTETSLIDENGLEITSAGKPGELVIRGGNVMQGYWNLPEETAKALRPGRFPWENILYSGDVFTKDEEGYLYFQGRKDDIIKTAGHLVSPKEVEDVLCEREDVLESAVIGIEDEILGKAIKAYIHLTDNSITTEQDIINFCRKHLEDFAVPRSVIFCDSLPKTDSGKIQKRELK